VSKRSSAARHRATPATTNPMESISKTVSSNAGTVGRQAAVVAVASGLVLSIGLPAQGSTPAVRESTSIPAPALDIERASLATVNVAAAKDVKVELDRAPVSSMPAPEPEPAPAPVIETIDEETAAPAPAARQTAPAPAAQQARPQQAAPQREARQAAPAQREARAQTAEVQQAAAPKPKAEPKPVAQAASVGGVVGAAYNGVGVPYVYGGKTTAGWDCSGFVAWAYRQAGITIPAQTSAILGSGLFQRTSNPKPGDLVFQNGGGHVGIYVGNGQMIGAQNPSVGTFQHSVTRNPLYGYYTYVG
jgi:peptidoglycan DL-endopeptidase CwlO